MLVVTNSINTEQPKAVKGLAPDRNLDKKIGVFDIETLRSTDSNGRVVFVPYLICILDRPVVGDNHKEGLMFYLNDLLRYPQKTLCLKTHSGQCYVENIMDLLSTAII